MANQLNISIRSVGVTSVSRFQNRAFTELIYRAPKNPDGAIVEDIFGIARFGEILAIVSASGTCKTTLQNVVIFDSDPTVNIHEGNVSVNEYSIRSSDRFSDILIGYAGLNESICRDNGARSIFSDCSRQDRILSFEVFQLFSIWKTKS